MLILRAGPEVDLILWRHAEALEAIDGGDDLIRPLTPRGKKQAVRMAGWLDRQLPEGARIMVSPALRCQQTVAALRRRYKTRDELGPTAETTGLLQLAQWPQGRGVVVLVGHQPALGDAIAVMLGLAHTELAVKKGAIWWLRSRAKDQREGSPAVLLAVQSPETV
jgi:phosphohistidine phosphatase